MTRVTIFWVEARPTPFSLRILSGVGGGGSCLPGCLLLSTLVPAKTLFVILFSIDAVADVVLSPSSPKDNTTRLQILLKVLIMKQS